MVDWHNTGCLDPDVWESFLHHHLDPALMPAPSELQLQTDEQDGQPQTEEKVNTIDPFIPICNGSLMVCFRSPRLTF